MAKGSNQKLKLLYLQKIFYDLTDEDNQLSISELIAQLASCGIEVGRKTLYEDIELLRTFGMDLIKDQTNHNTTYYLGVRDFELPELKLLVDSVQSAKFISEDKSNALIRKLEMLDGKSNKSHLQRQVLISGRVKTINQKVYYNVDQLHNAINKNKQISFQYFQWDIQKQMVLRNDGNPYQISPWYLVWDDEYYYLIAYDSQIQDIKHFRVDKMLNIETSEMPRDGK